MDISQISAFVRQVAVDAKANFTLDGEQITSKDLGAPEALLPLVILAANSLHEEISGQRSSHLDFVEPASPDTHLLGWKVKKLPELPDGALLLLVNYAIRTKLANSPAHHLSSPFLHQLDVPGKKSELRSHLDALSLTSGSALSMLQGTTLQRASAELGY